MINHVFGLAVRAIISDDKDQILIIKRSIDSKTNPGKWELPGGKVDEGESFDQALLREVFEETKLKVNLEHVIGVAEQNLHLIRAVHIIMSTTILEGELILSDEHDGYAWINFESLPDYDLADWLQDYVDRNFLNKDETSVGSENVLKPWIGSISNSLDKILKK
jgi:8-oxo-dGTP diphosphatase